jgi:hypothetical protein
MILYKYIIGVYVQASKLNPRKVTTAPKMLSKKQAVGNGLTQSQTPSYTFHGTRLTISKTPRFPSGVPISDTLATLRLVSYCAALILAVTDTVVIPVQRQLIPTKAD